MSMTIEECMRLAREAGDVERRHCIGKAQGFDVRDAYAALEYGLRKLVEEVRQRRRTITSPKGRDHEWSLE